ncbi:uncharacterized protein [Amphiura filiformis]|uniref:uncharacterized protein n=1 Tax=Amphiura filiformis TaxID=82378 RepID=UPI003B219F2F
MDALKQDPNWQQLFQMVSSDKQLAIRIAKKQREIAMNPDTHQHYEYDPSQKDGLSKFWTINEKVHKQALEECGLGKYVKDIKGFNTLNLLMGNWRHDPEVVGELNHVVRVSEIMKKPPEIGSARPDIDLVSAETKEIIPLSALRTRQSQPLVIIASSLSPDPHFRPVS